MNILISQKYEQIIKEVARSIEETAICEGTSTQDFKLKTARQIVEIQRRTSDRQNLENDIFDFIKDQKPNIIQDIKSFLKKIKIFSANFLSFLALFLISVLLVFVARWIYLKQYQILASILYLASCFFALIFWIRLVYLNRYILLKPTTYTKLKEQWKISATDEFAGDLANKYSPSILKLEEENLKMVINSLEQRDKIFSAGTIILAVIIFLAMRYLLEDLYKLVINNTPQWTGDVGIVFIVSTVFAIALNVGYFNDLIYYKQALSSLQKAQTYITNKT